MNPKQTSGSFRLRGLRLSAALFAVALLSGTTTEDAQRLESRRRKIEMLSQSELNQLKRNYENYLKLSPERREQLFRLHDELEQDAKNGGHLQKLLGDYNRWFSKLSPFDREKLLSTADPGERAQLVQKLREEQKQRVRAARFPSFPPWLGPLHGSPPLSSSEVDAVLTAVEENFLSETTKKRLSQSASGRDRHLRILRLVMEQLRRERDGGMELRSREATLIKTMINAIPNETVKSQISSAGAPLQVRRQLGQIVGRSILAEWKSELDATPATPTQIEETIKKLVAARRADRREAIQERLQTENGRRFAAIVAAWQTNPKLKGKGQSVFWLLGGLQLPQANRAAGVPGRTAGPASSAASQAESPDKDSSGESN